MGKNWLQDMSAVEAAQHWAKSLVHRESRGPGDMEGAMRRLEAKYGIPWRAFWSLRYRPPTSICADLWLRLRAAHEAECQRQMRLIEHELEITKAIAGPAHPVVVEIETRLGSPECPDDE